MGGPNRSIKTPASIVSESLRYTIPPPRKGDSTLGEEECIEERTENVLLYVFNNYLLPVKQKIIINE